jgi:hypothetical protein
MSELFALKESAQHIGAPEPRIAPLRNGNAGLDAEFTGLARFAPADALRVALRRSRFGAAPDFGRRD